VKEINSYYTLYPTLAELPRKPDNRNNILRGGGGGGGGGFLYIYYYYYVGTSHAHII